jgi:hypothetical protein
VTEEPCENPLRGPDVGAIVQHDLANTDAVDYTVKSAIWKPENTELSTACGDRQSLGVREVLSTGSGDTYAQYLPGQSFDLSGLRNGTYYIKIKTNPKRTFTKGRQATTPHTARLSSAHPGRSDGQGGQGRPSQGVIKE